MTALVRRWEASGDTQEVFAQRYGMSPAKFRYWRRRVESLGTGAVAFTSVQVRDATGSEAGVVEVALVTGERLVVQRARRRICCARFCRPCGRHNGAVLSSFTCTEVVAVSSIARGLTRHVALAVLEHPSPSSNTRRRLWSASASVRSDAGSRAVTRRTRPRIRRTTRPASGTNTNDEFDPEEPEATPGGAAEVCL
jgi:hypothetical protein